MYASASNLDTPRKRRAYAHKMIEAHRDGVVPEAVEYRAEPFELRAGGQSHWYVDARQGLAPGSMLSEGSRLMVASANVRRLRREVVAGMGIAGSALGVEFHALLLFDEATGRMSLPQAA